MRHTKRSAFAWQEGYGAFTVSPCQRMKVYNYINNQQEHHAATTFKEEYLHMLELAEIDYDERFVFD